MALPTAAALHVPTGRNSAARVKAAGRYLSGVIRGCVPRWRAVGGFQPLPWLFCCGTANKKTRRNRHTRGGL